MPMYGLVVDIGEHRWYTRVYITETLFFLPLFIFLHVSISIFFLVLTHVFIVVTSTTLTTVQSVMFWMLLADYVRMLCSIVESLHIAKKTYSISKSVYWFQSLHFGWWIWNRYQYAHGIIYKCIYMTQKCI